MWDLIVEGGYTMVPLLACSVISLAIIIEKLILLRKDVILNPDLLRELDELSSRKDIEGMKKVCQQKESLFSDIVSTMLENIHLPPQKAEPIVEREGRLQIKRLQNGLVVLEIISSIAPLLGLLGTVFGLIDVFRVVATLGTGKTSAFAGGIAKALVTTVAGLIIAIPSLIAYRYFANKVDIFTGIVEKEAHRIFNRLY